jgi:hypothetical protein
MTIRPFIVLFTKIRFTYSIVIRAKHRRYLFSNTLSNDNCRSHSIFDFLVQRSYIMVLFQLVTSASQDGSLKSWERRVKGSLGSSSLLNKAQLLKKLTH